MAVPRNGHLYALTSLQIGDIQSYVSRLFLFVACEGLKLVFLVDNGPWTFNTRPSRPAELWQLMVNKSRGSPFANRLRDYANGDSTSQQGLSGKETSDIRVEAGKEKEDGWLSLLVALQRSFKERVQVKKPSHGLYGCVAFEVAWSDVRGINYTNELQTDTCLSLEVRVMTKREFDSLEQAQACYATILSGSKDLGPSLGVSRNPGSKTGSNIFKRVGADNFQELVPEQARATKVHTENAIRGARPSGAVDKKQSRQRNESTRSYASYTSSATLISELSRAYISSVTSRFVSRLDQVSLGSLPPEYYTPPSSPYSGQVLQSLFKNYTSRQRKESNRSQKDPRKFRIVPIEDDSQTQTVPENRIFKLKQASERASMGVADKSKTSHGRNHSAAVSYSFDQKRHLSCPRCGGVMKEGTLSWSSAQDCGRCSATADVRQDSVFVHPDRLIAPAETYRDTLILFRFSEPLLPLELRQIITADRRLLKMLESGLPPWVIFLQSYPILCHLYRPWMRPLCGTIYYLVSIVTVLIGFYDLYKNVPVLKAAAAHICGPLFKWIEEWGMISRLRYLGTMLFLQNCEKAFEWGLAVTRAGRQVSMLVMRPILQPLVLFGETFLPLWVGVSYGVQTLVQFISAALASLFSSIFSMFSILIWPFMAFLTAVCNLGRALLFPVFATIWKVLILPLQLMKLFVSLIAAISSEVTGGLQNLWLAVHDSVQCLLASRLPAFESLQMAKSSTSSPSMWRTLWNDILSKVFHAVNGIVKGLAAFITACNRHRLSIYNQVVEFLCRVTHLLKSGQYVALTACRQMFLPPGQLEVGLAPIVNEGDAEPEDKFERNYFQSELGPGMRYRPNGTVSLPPLLLMQGQISDM